MTDLRDARLGRALEEAPDAQVQPHARTRAAIRAAAHAAVQPAWRRWWTRAQAHPQGWTAAFASVLAATLVTVTWQGREVPGARPDAETAAVAPAPAVAPPAAPPAAAPAPGPAPEPAPAPMAPPAAKPQLRESIAEAGRAAPQHRNPPTLQDVPATAEALAKQRAAIQRDEEQRARKAEAPERGFAQAPAAAPAAPVAETQSGPGAAAPAAAAPPAPAPAPALRPPAAPAPASPPAAVAQAPAALRAAPGVLPWSQVRIESAGGSVVVPRPQAGELPALVTSLLASISDEAEAATPASLRLELAQGDEVLGVLELVGERWRWRPQRPPGASRWLRAEPALANALREEAQRQLRR